MRREFILSGQIDTLSLEHGILSDYKFSTVWKFKRNSPPEPEWVAQLNLQLELLRQNGLDASKLQIVGLVRDYRKHEARDFPDSYPLTPIVIVPIPMWSRDETRRFIEERIRLHEEAMQTLPECTPSERWAKDSVYAVMKGKRAIRGGLWKSEQAAKDVQANNAGTRIEFRPAVNVRCLDYCAVAAYCDQYQKLREGIAI